MTSATPAEAPSLETDGEFTYDVVVIGAGPVGENVADRAVQGGLSVAIVESELVGGECSYWACMPSKALIRPGQVLRQAQNLPGVAEAVTGSLDVAAVLKRRTAFTSGWKDSGQVRWLDSAGIVLHRGHGRIAGPKTVSVTAADGSTQTLRARFAVAVAPGTSARIPNIDGLAASAPWTNREATEITEVPESLIIVGGGVVAVELATAYNDLGCDVTILARSGLLGALDAFAGEAVAEALADRGVRIELGASPTSVTRRADGVRVAVDGGAEFVAREILVATGRVPRTEDLGLDTVGLTPGDWITTDDSLLALGEVPGDEPWLYAVGDVNGRVLLTHQGKYQARAVGDIIVARATNGTIDDAPWGRHVATADHAAVPQVIFSSPEVGQVGLSESEARAADIDAATVDIDLGSIAGESLKEDGASGRFRTVIDRERGVIVGVTVVGSDIAELIHAATIAIVGEVPIARLWHAVPVFPTTSEVWLRVLESYGRESA